MNIYPAIDIRAGRVVRLQEGDPARQTVFGDDPRAVAEQFAAAGARWLHVVNLDGAFGEDNVSGFASVLRALCAVGPRVQCGGGLRSLAHVEAALAAGAVRVVLGTLAVEQPARVEQAVARFGAPAVAVGIDARDGQVRVRGWRGAGGLTAVDLGRRVRAQGVELAVHTDIARDGLLGGVNAGASAALAQATALRVIVSGGVAGLDDIRRVAERAGDGLAGVIAGRALYEGMLDLREALRLC